MAAKSRATDNQGRESGGQAISKAEAIRQALANGIESPSEGVEFVKREFGIDLSPTHFSAGKSLAKKMAEAKSQGNIRGRSNPYFSNNADLIEAMEVMKPLVASLGVEKVKRLAELLG